MTLGDCKIQMFVLLNSLWTDTLFVTAVVITVLSRWARSNRICLHMISTHTLTWNTFGSCQQYCPGCPEKNYVLLAAIPTVAFCWSYGKTTKIHVNAVGLHLRSSSSKRNNVKLAQVIIQALNHRILSIILFSFLQEPESVRYGVDLIIKQKSKYHKSVGCSYCKLNHIGSLSALASSTKFED